MKETEKLKLKLPEISDWADITALNDNFQALDSWLEQLKSDIIAKLNDTPAKDHTHTRKDITDFPTSLPASDVYDWAKQPNKPVYTAGEVGAAASSHTHPVGNITGVLPVSKGGTGQTSLSALMSAMGAGKIVVGTYTGNGNESMTINLGFTPKAVLLLPADDAVNILYECYGFNSSQYNDPRESALCVQGQTISNGSYKVMSVGASGFTVYYYFIAAESRYQTNYFCHGNESGKKFNYVAFG